MSRTASVLFLCCLGLGSLSPSTAQADTSQLSEPAHRAPWRNRGLFSGHALSSFKLKPLSVRSSGRPWSDRPDYASAFTPSRLKATRVTAWTLTEDHKAAFELTLPLGHLETVCDGLLSDGAGCSSAATTPSSTAEEPLPQADRARGSDVLADLGVDANSVSPTLLRYSDEETNVSLLISPGGPCTGACLKLAGSF